MKYHINPETGNVSKCSAKKRCPFGDLEKDHYPNQDAARVAYELKNNAVVKPRTLKHEKIEKMIDQILTSELYPKVEKPSWWNAMVAKEEVKLDNNEPVLLQIIDTSIGKMAAVWQDKSPQKQDSYPREKAIETTITYLRDWETGEQIGYLKLSYVSDETLNEAFGTDDLRLYRYDEYYNGRDYDFEDYKTDTHDVTEAMTPEEKQEFKRAVWAGAVRNRSRPPKTWQQSGEMWSQNATVAHAPTDPKVLDEELKFMAEGLEESLQDKKAYWEVPLPAYSRIRSDGDFQGQGLGSALYLSTARHLGQKGQLLKAASSRTDEALAVWNRFTESDKIPTTNVKIISKDSFGAKDVTVYPALDFTQ